MQSIFSLGSVSVLVFCFEYISTAIEAVIIGTLLPVVVLPVRFYPGEIEI